MSTMTMTSNRVVTENTKVNNKVTFAERVKKYYKENALLIAGGLAAMTGNNYAATQLMMNR